MKYEGPVIDPHIHLWELAGGHHPWLDSPEANTHLPSLETIRSDYLPHDYLSDAAGHNIVASVHVEANWTSDQSPVNETRWLESLDKPEGAAARYVGAAPFGQPDSIAILEEQASFERVVGVRQALSWHPDPAKSIQRSPGLTLHPRWRECARQASDLGLSLDVLLFPWQADELVQLAAAIPELQLIVDHAISPLERDTASIETWRRAVSVLSTQPNIAIKISGLGAPDDDPRWGEGGSLRYFIREIVEEFGVDRAMFASDFPVGRLKNSFDGIYSQFHAFASQLSRDEQRALFHDTAARIYMGQ